MKNDSNKDLELKLMCKSFFDYMGFISNFEIKIRNKSYINEYKTHDVSDIDVLGYRFFPDLTFHTLGAECKSGEENALEELFKFFGVIKFYNLNKGYLLKTKIHQNARQVSQNMEITCYSVAELRKLLLGFGIDVDKSVNVERAKHYKLQKALKDYKKKNEKLIDFLQLQYWNKENWRNIQNLIHIISNSNQSNLNLFNDSTIEDKFIYYYTLQLFSLSLLKNLSIAMKLNYSDIEHAIISSLYGGAESLNERRKIHDEINLALKENKEFEPSWQKDLVNISTRFSQNTKAASEILHIIYQVIETGFYPDKLKINTKILKGYNDISRKFVQDIMQFLIKNCKINPKIFEDFMSV